MQHSILIKSYLFSVQKSYLVNNVNLSVQLYGVEYIYGIMMCIHSTPRASSLRLLRRASPTFRDGYWFGLLKGRRAPPSPDIHDRADVRPATTSGKRCGGGRCDAIAMQQHTARARIYIVVFMLSRIHTRNMLSSFARKLAELRQRDGPRCLSLFVLMKRIARARRVLARLIKLQPRDAAQSHFIAVEPGPRRRI